MIQTLQSHRDRTTLTGTTKRIGVIYHDDSEYWDSVEDLRENVLDNDGQYISLDLAETMETLPSVSLAEMFYTALKNVRWEQSLSFSLPDVLRHNPRVASPFINRAILWHRLCDLLILDDDPRRETVLVLENVDQASPAIKNEIARLIRFHEAHSLNRRFIFTRRKTVEMQS